MDADEIGDFFIDVFKLGGLVQMRVLEQPDDWQYRFYDGDTGLELAEEAYSLTPISVQHNLDHSYGSLHQPTMMVLTLATEISVSSKSSELRTDVAFTVAAPLAFLR